MDDLACVLAFLLFLGLLLVIFRKPLVDGFAGSMGPEPCSVDMPCSGHLKCINGFCAKTDPVGVKEANPVPLLPDGAAAPYF